MTRISKILVPVDFSPSSRAALDFAVGLAAKLGASVDVLHVREPSCFAIPEPACPVLPVDDDHLRDEAMRDMHALVASARIHVPAPAQAPVDVRPRLESGDARDTILRLIGKDHYDLVVMGTHGWTGAGLLLMGSIAEGVVRRATCPVLTVRPPEAQPEAKAQADGKTNPAGARGQTGAKGRTALVSR